MSSWPGGTHAITLFVGALEAAKRFYRDLFGLSASFEDDDSTVITFGNTQINLLAERVRIDIAPGGRINPQRGNRDAAIAPFGDLPGHGAGRTCLVPLHPGRR